jgi:hypothetical protein
MKLERIYEAQMFETHRDRINKKLQNVKDTMDTIVYAFIQAKMQYNAELKYSPDFYKHEMNKLEEMEHEFLELREKFENKFIKHQFTNHPNPEMRKDLR